MRPTAGADRFTDLAPRQPLIPQGNLPSVRALAAGLELRPIDDTPTDTLDCATAHHIDTVIGAGLTNDEERGFLEAHNEP